MIKGKTPEEIRKLFNIVNDFTPEEEVRGFPLFIIACLTASFSGSNQEGEREWPYLSHAFATDPSFRNGQRTDERRRGCLAQLSI
jgi:hypothetical protein